MKRSRQFGGCAFFVFTGLVAVVFRNDTIASLRGNDC